MIRWAALVVTDRRWAAPLTAMALGMGMFIGVAIGPGAAGTLATGQQVIEISGFGGDAGDEDSSDGDGTDASIADPAGFADGTGFAPPPRLPLAPAPAPAPVPTPVPTAPATPAPAPAPIPDEKPLLEGTVVHANPLAGSYTVATPGGTIESVHASESPVPGSRVSVQVRQLFNGTFVEDGTRERTGSAKRATISGTITFRDPEAETPAYTVSWRGASLLVRVRPPDEGEEEPALPQLGALTTVEVEIGKRPRGDGADEGYDAEEEAPPPPSETCVRDEEDPALKPAEPAAFLWHREAKTSGPPATYSDFAGIVSAACPKSSELLLSADGIRESGRDIAFSVPKEVALEKLKVGRPLLVTAEIGADGKRTLTGLASDEKAQGADDPKLGQGDLAAG